MFCPSCGTTVEQTLNYCKRCGTRLNDSKVPGKDAPTEPFRESLVWAMVTVFIVGLGTTIGLMAVMQEVLHFPRGLIIGISLFSLLLTLGLETVFIWMLLGRKKSGRPLVSPPLVEEPPKKPAALPASPPAEPILSVTEHTTHSFEPAQKREPESKCL